MLRSLSKQLLPLASNAVRCLSSAQPATAAAGEQKVDKESLMKLRRKTGYSYVNCRKALLQFGADLGEAEKWLRQNAEKEGWAKAAKLSSRKATQGLVAVKYSPKVAAAIELSCETDFVARGEAFKQLLDSLATATLSHAEREAISSNDKMVQKSYEPENVSSSDGKSLKEIITLAVGRLGENITAKRIEVFFAPTNAEVYANAHPKEGNDSTLMGKFVSIIALKRDTSVSQFPTDRLAGQICQHIIGMRSESLGTPPTPEEQSKKEEIKNETAVDNQDELNDFFKGETTQMDADETQLLRQAFMLNPSQTVFEYASGHGAQILDFARVELGGESSSD